MTLQIRCLSSSLSLDEERSFVFDSPALDPHAGQCMAVVLVDGAEARAAALLQAGVPQVLIGEAALLDSGVVERLSARFGSERIGLYVPARNLAVDWSFETVSNADFRVVTPSICEPTWEVLRADGSGTGTHAEWWIDQMVARGAGTILLRADVDNDADLNLCAGLVEKHGERLWLCPLACGNPPLDDWVAFGQARQLVLPLELYQQHEIWACLLDAGQNDLKECA